jgi:hypothetical protein
VATSIASVEPELGEKDFGEVIHAYACVESKAHPGSFYAVHLSNGVIAGKLELIGISNAPTHPHFATNRMVSEIQTRRERKAWSKP